MWNSKILAARLTLGVLHFFPVTQSVIQVEIGCVGSVFPSYAGTLAFMGPAYEMAIEEVNQRYSGIFNLSVTFLVGADDIRTCPGVRQIATEMLAEWYYRKRRHPTGLAVLMTPGCIDSGDAHQLTANWNILYLNTAGGEKSPYTLPAAPIISTSFLSLPDISKALVDLLLLYDWTTVYMVVDQNGPPVYGFLAQEVMKLQEASLKFTVLTCQIAPKTLMSYQSVLEEFARSSRVMLFLGQGDELRRLLIEAYHRNMTNGEYVYIGNQATEFKSYGTFSWQHGDAQDEIARDAFRSVLFVHPNGMVKNFSAPIERFLEQVKDRSIQEFKIPFSADQLPPRETLTAYSSISFLGQVLNSTLTTMGVDGVFDSQRLVQGFLNHTFHNNFSDIFIDRSGLRRIELAVSTLSTLANTSKSGDPSKQAFLVQSRATNFEFTLEENMSNFWPGGKWPPPNQPLCGYSNQNSACSGGSGSLWKDSAEHTESLKVRYYN